MGIVLHRTTGEFRESVHTPDFNPTEWVILQRGDSRIATLRTLLQTVPSQHVAIRSGDVLEEMTAGEKATVEAVNAVLFVQSDAAPDIDGIPSVAANGVAQHTISITKRGLRGGIVASGTETVRVLPESPITTSRGSFALVAGAGSVTVGPTLLRGALIIRFTDTAGVLRPASIRLRFQ